MSRYFNQIDIDSGNDLEHYGVQGMKWGIRKYQNPDGTLTAEGKKKYGNVYGLGDAYRKKGSKIGAAIGAGAGVAAVVAGNKHRPLGSAKRAVGLGILGAVTGASIGSSIGSSVGYRKGVGKKEIAAQKKYGLYSRNGINSQMINRQLELEAHKGYNKLSEKDNRAIGRQLLKEYGEDSFRRYINSMSSERYEKGTVDDILKKYGRDSVRFNRENQY